MSLFERDKTLGGLWAARLDGDGRYVSENSCKVYQENYHTTPALLRLLGTRWEEHFVQRHDLSRDWLRPFCREATFGDLAKIVGAFSLFAAGVRSYRDVSVGDWLERHAISEPCRAWMRATALGGITGTLRMTMWELFLRLGGNMGSIVHGRGGALYWNARPPNAPGGFVSKWDAALRQANVAIHLDCAVTRLAGTGTDLTLLLDDHRTARFDAVFLALPPRALARLLSVSPPSVAAGFGRDLPSLLAVLEDSLYEHLGLAWHFDRALPRDLPLGGHNVRRGWHPILVQHAQYQPDLPAPAVSVVVGSVSLATDLRHQRLGTRARDHSHAELARILWEDERHVDPSLPEPIASIVHGMSDATQLVGHGPLPPRAVGAEIYLATNLSGAAPYFTASLESAIQAGSAAACAFDSSVHPLPVGPTRQVRESARTTRT